MAHGPIEAQKVETPRLRFTPEALTQFKLINDNDFTLSGKFFRILISGKGCDGFTYSVGFTDWNEEDIKVPIRDEKNQLIKESIEVLMDPFTAFYLQDVSVDYLQDFANNNEGFVVTNENQKQFAGKFWRQDEDKIPPLKESMKEDLSL